LSIRELVSDMGVEMIGAYVGTKVMEQVPMKLYELEPEEDRQRAEEVGPGSPYEIAAKKTIETLGIELSEEQLRKVAITVSTTAWEWVGGRPTPFCAGGPALTRSPPGCFLGRRCRSWWTRG
jgi:hypothetical protein